MDVDERNGPTRSIGRPATGACHDRSKNAALMALADQLIARRAEILAANAATYQRRRPMAFHPPCSIA